MKLIDVCEFYAPRGGGVRTYVEARFAAAARLGHELVVVAPGPENRTEPRAGAGRLVYVAAPGLPVDRRYGMFWESAPVFDLLDRERPDVVEASSPWRAGWLVRDWPGAALKSLFMHHDPLSVWAYRWFDGIAGRHDVDRAFDWMWAYLRRLSAPFDQVISASPSLTRRLEASRIGPVATTPMGVEAGRFSPVLRDEALRASLLERCGHGADAALLLGVGRHTPEKRWPCVIDAVSAVAARRPVGLVLVGEGHDQPAVFRRVAGDPHVQVLATVRDRVLLARLMASADLLVHGSSAETFGFVAAEALASGLPVIAPDEGAVADLRRRPRGGGPDSESGVIRPLAGDEARRRREGA